MKVRPPVDLHLARIEKIAPSPQTVRRDAMCRGVPAHAHSAPRHRLDVHRPERLHGLIPFVARQPKMRATSALALQFGLHMQGVRVSQNSEPAHESCSCKPVLCAIAALRQTTSLPGFDMYRPKGTVRFVLEMFRTHRRISTAAENPIWNDSARSGSRAGFGRLQINHGWQDKSAAVGRTHVVGWVAVFPMPRGIPRWRFCPKAREIKDRSAVVVWGDLYLRAPR